MDKAWQSTPIHFFFFVAVYSTKLSEGNINAYKESGVKSVVALHCNSLYPWPTKIVSLLTKSGPAKKLQINFCALFIPKFELIEVPSPTKSKKQTLPTNIVSLHTKSRPDLIFAHPGAFSTVPNWLELLCLQSQANKQTLPTKLGACIQKVGLQMHFLPSLGGLSTVPNFRADSLQNQTNKKTYSQKSLRFPPETLQWDPMIKRESKREKKKTYLVNWLTDVDEVPWNGVYQKFNLRLGIRTRTYTQIS